MPAPADAFVAAEFRELPPVELNFNDTWQLAGLRFSEESGHLALSLHWRCLRICAGWLCCFAHVLDSEGRQISTMDHDVLGGNPAPAEWRPGDEGYEIRYLELDRARLQSSRLSLGPGGYEVRPGAAASPVFRLRLGLFDFNTGLRLPLVASSLPATDHYTAACAEANVVPGAQPLFRFELPPLAPCRVVFGEGVELAGFAVGRLAEAVWVRLRWNIRRLPAGPIRFFGHGVAARDAAIDSLVSFDQEMMVERRGPAPSFEQDIVRALPEGGPEPLFLRAGVCTSQGIERLEIRESTVDRDSGQRCLFIPIRR